MLMLGLLAASGATGCRSGRPEVPPEQPYLPPSPALGPQTRSMDAPHVGFSSEPPAGGSPYGVAAAAENPFPPGMAPTRVAGANEATLPAVAGQPAYGTVPGTAAYNAVAPPPSDSATRPAAADIPGPDPLQGLPALGPGGAAEPPR
jgi:hypothetical protein